MASAVTSIYNNVISAASAGFAPTNSADVSAIASSYQVVSATATQLYAGTSYLTSVNDNPLSASRAGNAANASMANSAYYDGTGRLISSLPDSATVSAIASSYAESAASSKQDTLTFGYNTANQISSIDGSALGGMDEAAVSGIASAYAESAVSAASSNYYPATSNPSGYLTAQAQASWSESASASPSYIQDKPDLVDIVAGPGIVVDNPDGNTLRVSTDQAIETVLWSGDALSATVSESLTNFESIKVYAHWHYNGSYEARAMTEIPGSATNFNLFTITPAGTTAQTNNANVYTLASIYGINGLNLTPTNKSRIQYAAADGSFSCNSYSNSDVLKLYKVVGIHRIAGGN